MIPIPIPIPVGKTHTHTATGLAAKSVPCEGCGTEYAYAVERSANGLLFANGEELARRAAAEAERALEKALERAVDPVPCPVCGWYQEHMLPSVRRAYARGWFVAGAGVTVAVLPLAVVGGFLNDRRFQPPHVPWPLFLTLLGVAFAIGLALAVTKYVLAASFDPNAPARLPDNAAVGRTRACTRTEFETNYVRSHSATEFGA
jgi:hypothetical protein